MKRTLALCCALMSLGCHSTRNTLNADRAEVLEQREVISAEHAEVATEVSNLDIVRVKSECVEVVDEPVVLDTLIRPKRTERRTTTTFEIDRSTFERMVADRGVRDEATHTTREVVEEVAQSAEVEDSTPRNLRWLSILGISVAVVAVCFVFLRFKK